jgi:DNA-binding HxlR family transcriptional regulator
MLKRDYEGQVCSVARSLEVVGERWTLLIVRDVFLGRRRFDEIRASLGIASNVLAERLNRLVDEGILERVRYSEHPDRFEYRPTPKSIGLRVAILALMQWGDEHLMEQPPRLARRRADSAPVRVALVDPDGAIVDPLDVETIPGPGAPDSSVVRRR